ncbi:MAG: hypothetical protein ABIH63_04170 [archaeon]
MKYVLASLTFLVSYLSKLVDVPKDFFNNYHLNLVFHKVMDGFTGFYLTVLNPCFGLGDCPFFTG